MTDKGTYANEQERQAMMERANAAYLESKKAREGEYGVKRQADMEAIRNQINSLENERGLNPRQAVENMKRADALRNQLEHMESTYDVLAAQDYNSRIAEQKAAQFSELQASLLSSEVDMALAVDNAWERIVYNTAIGVSRKTIDRQLAKLVSGEGETDQHGRFVRFSEGRNTATYRAYVNSAGDYAVVLESRGSDMSRNGLGNLAE